MALWTAGILVALGLAWFVGAVVVPLARTRKVVAGQVGKSFDAAAAIRTLGGEERAAGSLALYYRLPPRFAPYKDTCVMLLADCGQVTVPVLRQALYDKDDRVRLVALLGLVKLQAVQGLPPEDLDEWALLNDGVTIAAANVTGGEKDILLETDHSGNSGGTTHFLIARLARESVEGKPLLDQDRKAAAELRAIQGTFDKGGCAWRGDPVSVARRSCAAGAAQPDAAEYQVGFRSDSLAMVLRKPAEPVQPPPALPNSGFSDGRERIFVYRPFFAELGAKSIWAASEEGMIGERILRE
jgi:hypothetical protein